MDLSQVRWRKSSYSGANNECVEAAFAADASLVAVRDSKNPTGGALVLPRSAWTALVSDEVWGHR